MELEASFLTIAWFIALGIFLPVVALTVGKWIRPNKPSSRKAITYESGVDPTGEGWVQFHVRYYLFALLFVIFDVETIFLYPWAVAYDSLRATLGVWVLYEMLIFIGLLVLGLAYAWKKKVLKWE
ncbi:NADH-quinone oxidoreductase subunit A [Croceifilum oryzae]|uniref:NADH-quinone oxidoreductase subunit A n=1 Tax=Croceifilum oryzae TaxID=1553429 RepID=A0AAJ1TC83_9BACL|nr:NADH-quinone oxidoreductase subunit A [Croceifilum oryzae]MDQ0415844.1 NADH-quinone oxidoreductase subunit A [Croceifilum oryzae]